MFSTGKMCKFSWTLYSPFYKISQSRESDYILHSCLVSLQSPSTMFRAVHSMHFIPVSLGESVSFSMKISPSHQNNHWLSQTGSSLLKFTVQYSERGYVLWNLCTICGPHHHDPRFIYLFYFQVFFFNRSSIPDSPSPILDPRSSILDPDFPVNRELLLMKTIVFFRPLK